MKVSFIIIYLLVLIAEKKNSIFYLEFIEAWIMTLEIEHG